MKLYQLPLLLLPAAVYGDGREYQFEAYVSSMFLSGTVDEIFFRLCNEDDECGLFTEVPAGWQSPGQSYSYTYSTKEDLGDIYKVQIVHPGSDQLCIGHIIVDGVEYDENEHKWIDWPHCIEETDGGGCDTVTIILPDNDWNSRLTIPCAYDAHLDATHSPTGAPSAEPTEFPTPSPTPMPTHFPSVPPTHSPSAEPTMEPTTASPVIAPDTTTTTMESTVEVELAQIGSDLEDGAHSKYDRTLVIGAVIGAAVTFVLCLCVTVFLAMYCWRKRRRLEQGVKVMHCASHKLEDMDLDDESSGVMIGKAPEIMTEGAGLRSGTMDTGSGRSGTGSYEEIGATPVSAAYDEGDDAVAVVVVAEDDVDAALLVASADDGSSDEGIYVQQNMDTSRRETLDLSQSLDEDILPKDDDEQDQRELEWLE